jgi:hypothetical protein
MNTRKNNMKTLMLTMLLLGHSWITPLSFAQGVPTGPSAARSNDMPPAGTAPKEKLGNLIIGNPKLSGTGTDIEWKITQCDAEDKEIKKLRKLIALYEEKIGQLSAQVEQNKPTFKRGG